MTFMSRDALDITQQLFTHQLFEHQMQHFQSLGIQCDVH